MLDAFSKESFSNALNIASAVIDVVSFGPKIFSASAFTVKSPVFTTAEFLTAASMSLSKISTSIEPPTAAVLPLTATVPPLLLEVVVSFASTFIEPEFIFIFAFSTFAEVVLLITLTPTLPATAAVPPVEIETPTGTISIFWFELALTFTSPADAIFFSPFLSSPVISAETVESSMFTTAFPLRAFPLPTAAESAFVMPSIDESYPARTFKSREVRTDSLTDAPTVLFKTFTIAFTLASVWSVVTPIFTARNCKSSFASAVTLTFPSLTFPFAAATVLFLIPAFTAASITSTTVPIPRPKPFVFENPRAPVIFPLSTKFLAITSTFPAELMFESSIKALTTLLITSTPIAPWKL